MSKAITVVTGASRGLGRALVRQLFAADHCIVAIARRPPADLEAEAHRAGAALHLWTADLESAAETAERLRGWLRAQAPQPAALINNAAALSTPGPLRDTPAAELQAAVRVGLEAPLMLTAAFLAATDGWPHERRVLNISSGLGRRAMAGSAGYCAIKAGLDHFARAVALEEAGRPHGARIVSLAPGVIDTDMQRQLRQADPARFAEQPRFAALAAQGLLDSADAAAQKVLRHLARADFGAEVIADVRDGD